MQAFWVEVAEAPSLIETLEAARVGGITSKEAHDRLANQDILDIATVAED